MRIIIADHHPVVRQGLMRILLQGGSYSYVGEAGSIQELRSALSLQEIDALVLELFMPGGLEALKEVRGLLPELPILVLSSRAEEQYGLRVFKSGAAGYISKECTSAQLIHALNEVILGKRQFSKITEDLIFNELDKKSTSKKFPHQHLSDRELHVLMTLGQGRTLTQISKDLSLSVKTISTYRQRILKKMELTTNAQLVMYVSRHSLSDVDWMPGLEDV